MNLPAQVELPRPTINGLTVSLFSAEPDIVTPTGIAVDSSGRVFCIESHTHFRPDDYKGPAKDRIRIYEDLDSDGKAEKVTTFFEGSVATMNLAFAPNGWLYVATRARIFRLRDTDGDNRADQNELIIDLKTKGNYPHNGLSGLAFDQQGRVYFGFGENLGVDYRMLGTDGVELTGGGEGGNVYCCNLDGSGLRHFSTGFWNPFGLAFDRAGNLFGIDNDPDWRPPCRLLHVVDGGDYGYRFSHGRRGTHPFTAWFGELPGTLGMVSGTGEAPSGIIRYDRMSTGNESVLLSTSWGIHSIEKFVLSPQGATFVSRPQTILKGGKDFRPVGIAEAPDGTIYISDWCKRSYPLHGHGRIWKLEFKKGDTTRKAYTPNAKEKYPYESSDPVLRQAAANRVESIDYPKAIQAAISPIEKATLIRRSRSDSQIDTDLLVSFLGDQDPFIRQAARFALSTPRHIDQLVDQKLPADPATRLGVALLMRKFSKNSKCLDRLSELLKDDDPLVQFTALRWIGEEKRTSFRQQLENGIRTRSLTGRLFESYLAALDMVNKGRKGAEFEKAEARILGEILEDSTTSPETLVVALRKLQSVKLRDEFTSDHPKLKPQLLLKLLKHPDKSVVREVIQTLGELDGPLANKALLEVAQQHKEFGDLVAYAIIGLNPEENEHRKILWEYLAVKNRRLQTAAIQTLIGTEIRESEKDELQILQSLNQDHPVRRLTKNEQSRKYDAAWTESILKKLPSADPQSGRQIFFNNRFGQCAKCHQVDGRGGMIGPDLSILSSMSVERLLESMVDPSKEVAPRHTSWLIETYDGRTINGVLVAERGELQSYADANGKISKVKFDDIERKKPSNKSIMPEELLNRMTDKEVADLIRFLKRG